MKSSWDRASKLPIYPTKPASSLVEFPSAKKKTYKMGRARMNGELNNHWNNHRSYISWTRVDFDGFAWIRSRNQRLVCHLFPIPTQGFWYFPIFSGKQFWQNEADIGWLKLGHLTNQTATWGPISNRSDDAWGWWQLKPTLPNQKRLSDLLTKMIAIRYKHLPACVIRINGNSLPTTRQMWMRQTTSWW